VAAKFAARGDHKVGACSRSLSVHSIIMCFALGWSGSLNVTMLPLSYISQSVAKCAGCRTNKPNCLTDFVSDLGKHRPNNVSALNESRAVRSSLSRA
jgi:hypothetical protein